MRQTRPCAWSTAQTTPSPAAEAPGSSSEATTDAVCVTLPGSNFDDLRCLGVEDQPQCIRRSTTGVYASPGKR